MASNLEKLADQLRDAYNGGQPDPQSRISKARARLLIEQIAPGVRKEDFERMYNKFGVQIINGQFVKDYTITLTPGGVGWKKAPLPAAVLALPTNRGFAYIYEPDSLDTIELVDKGLFGGLSNGILQCTGQYFACPVGDYLEIRGKRNDKLVPLTAISAGLVVPDETCLDEASDYIVLERALAVLKGQPFPDMNVNANAR